MSKNTKFKVGDEVIIKDTDSVRYWCNGKRAIGYAFKLTEEDVKHIEEDSNEFTLCNNKFGINFNINDIEKIGKSKTNVKVVVAFNPRHEDAEPVLASKNNKLTAEERKGIPVYSGFIKYFPRAILAVARLSKIANDQHNPNEPLHWAKEKSQDEQDAMMRHLIDDIIDEKEDTDGVLHITKVAWRAMANLERALENDNK